MTMDFGHGHGLWTLLMVKKGNLAVWTLLMVKKGNLAVFEGSSISKTGEAPPTKIGVHACDINPYLLEFFEPIPID